MHTHFWLPHCFSKSVHYLWYTSRSKKSNDWVDFQTCGEVFATTFAVHFSHARKAVWVQSIAQFCCHRTVLYFFTYRRSFLSVTIGGFVCLLYYFLWLLLNNVKSALWMCCMKLCTTVHALITFFPSPPHSQQSLQTDHRRHEQVIFFYHCLLTVILLLLSRTRERKQTPFLHVPCTACR